MKNKSSPSPKKTSPRGREAAAPIHPRGVRTANIVQRITDEIVNGVLLAGAELPGEGTLAKSYGVSRTVMREAMRMLRGYGLIDMTQGKPPRVKPPDLESAVFGIELLLRRNRASLLNLVEARRPLEAEIAALAAVRANDEHARQLEHSIYALATASTLAERVEADVAFHRILAEATGNPVFVLLLKALAGFLQESRQKTLSYSGAELAIKGHRAILTAVRAHDAEAARAAMFKHLFSAERDLLSIQTHARAPA